MNLADYRGWLALFASEPPLVRVLCYANLAHVNLADADPFFRQAAAEFHYPLSKWERGLAEPHIARAKAEPPVWYHAGLAGRAVGDVLLPRGTTGGDPFGLGKRTPGGLRFVYFARSLFVARRYKAGNEQQGHAAAIYEVTPEGEIEMDPEGLRFGIMLDLDPEQGPEWQEETRIAFSSFRAKSATVTRVLEGRSLNTAEAAA